MVNRVVCLIFGYLELILIEYVSCDCPPGWCSIHPSQELCNIATQTMTCLHADTQCSGNGQCLTVANNTQCICDALHFGRYCQYKYLSSPAPNCNSTNVCLNGGLCISTISMNETASNVFKCRCLPGYHGNICEKETLTVLVEAEDCQNGGTSYVHGGLRGCLCVCGFAGFLCDIKLNVSRCDASTCANGGTCIETRGTTSCRCQEGITGSTCQLSVVTTANVNSNSPGINNLSIARILTPVSKTTEMPNDCNHYGSGCTNTSCSHSLLCIVDPCNNPSCVDSQHNQPVNTSSILKTTDLSTTASSSSQTLLEIQEPILLIMLLIAIGTLIPVTVTLCVCSAYMKRKHKLSTIGTVIGNKRLRSENNPNSISVQNAEHCNVVQHDFQIRDGYTAPSNGSTPIVDNNNIATELQPLISQQRNEHISARHVELLVDQNRRAKRFRNTRGRYRTSATPLFNQTCDGRSGNNWLRVFPRSANYEGPPSYEEIFGSFTRYQDIQINGGIGNTAL